MNETLNKLSPHILSLLRFISGFLMVWHGAQKLFNYPPKENFAPAAGIILVAGILELGGGILLILGLFTRWTAFVMSGLMAFAYWKAHGTNGKGFLPILNGGELAVLYCFVYLYLFFAGGGSLSLDKLIWKKE